VATGGDPDGGREIKAVDRDCRVMQGSGRFPGAYGGDGAGDDVNEESDHVGRLRHTKHLASRCRAD